MNKYEIAQKEPEGWEKAFEVTVNGKVVAYFSFLDSAEHYVREAAH